MMPITRRPKREPGETGRDWRRACIPRPVRVTVEITRQEKQSFGADMWRRCDKPQRHRLMLQALVSMLIENPLL